MWKAQGKIVLTSKKKASMNCYSVTGRKPWSPVSNLKVLHIHPPPSTLLSSHSNVKPRVKYLTFSQCKSNNFIRIVSSVWQDKISFFKKIYNNLFALHRWCNNLSKCRPCCCTFMKPNKCHQVFTKLCMQHWNYKLQSTSYRHRYFYAWADQQISLFPTDSPIVDGKQKCHHELLPIFQSESTTRPSSGCGLCATGLAHWRTGPHSSLAQWVCTVLPPLNARLSFSRHKNRVQVCACNL